MLAGFPAGAGMTLRLRAAFCALASLVFISGCGITFRPIATPTTSGGGDPQVRRHAVVVSNNGPGADGAATHINISGDTNAGQVPLGQDPVHAGIIPGNAVTMVANRASSSGKPSVTAYTTFDQPVSPALPISTTLPDNAAPGFVYPIIGQVFVTMPGLNSVGIFSPSAGGLQGQIAVGTNPVAVTGFPDGARIYVANQGSNDVTVIRPSDSVVVATIPVGTAPTDIIISADAKLVYVVNRDSDSVSVIDTATNTVTATVPVGAAPTFAAFDAKNLRVYVANSGSNTITAIHADPNQTASSTPPCSTNCFLSTVTITVGSNPAALTVLADGSRIYVANPGSNSISVVGGLSLAVQTTLTLPNPAGGTLQPVHLASSPDSTKVVVAAQDTVAVTATDPDASAIVTIRTSDHLLTTIPAPTAPGACANASPGGCRMKPVYVTVTR